MERLDIKSLVCNLFILVTDICRENPDDYYDWFEKINKDEQ